MLHKESKSNREQIQMISIDQLVPDNHVLRKIDRYVDFDYIYDLVQNYYSSDNGRPSIDPVLLFKLALLQRLFGIRSMRQTIKDVNVNLAYRWFLGLGLTDSVPHFSTFGKNYERRFKGTTIFQDIFEGILMQVVDAGCVDSRIQFVDSTHVKAHANRHKKEKVMVRKEVKKYQQALEREISQDRKEHGKEDLKPPKNPPNKMQERTQSTSDPESGLFHKGDHKEVFAYSVQTSADKNGWILAYEVYPGNLHDSTTFLDFYEKELQRLKPKKCVMDAGYKIPAIAQKLLQDHIQPVFPYTRPKGMKKNGKNSFRKKEYLYDEYYDCYLCPEGHILAYSTTDRQGYKQYKSRPKTCKKCPSIASCTKSKNHQKVVTRHVWADALEQCEAYRLTDKGKEEYKQRKQTIERIFGTAKEYHGFRYTLEKGLEKLKNKVALTYAAMNIKKLVKIMEFREDPIPV